MARSILSKLLIQYQAEEEASIRSIAESMDESGKELIQTFYEPFKITSEDLSRDYTAIEVEELCLRTKLRVNMTMFNCVWDAKKRLETKGRLKNRSERFINAMLVKAVSRKMVSPYSDNHIANCNHIRQCQLKKENNCRLDRWHLNPHLEQARGILETDQDSDSSESQQSVVTELPGSATSSLAPSPLLILGNVDLRNTEFDNEQDLINDDVEADVIDEPVVIGEPIVIDEPLVIGEPIVIDEPVVIGEPLVSSEPLVISEPIVISEPVVIDDSVVSHPPVEWLNAAAEINSESMSLGSRYLQSQPTQSQAVASNTEDYFLFDTQVPASSTQDR